MTPNERRNRLAKLGYGLRRSVRCGINGRVYPFCTSPVGGNGGPTNYFRSAAEVDKYIEQVEQMRDWQTDPIYHS